MHTIENKNGMTVDIIELGATVVTINVPDRNGNLDDVIIGFENPEDFKNNSVYFGTIAGRYANRIDKGKFSLNGKKYQLTVNSGSNHLHGGLKGINQKTWHVENITSNSIKLSCTSPDGEEGYPGNVKISVTYSVTEDNGLKIDYEGVTDVPTILNLTNHCYFNLAGQNNNSILDHEVFIDADKFTPVDQNIIPTGELADVVNTPMDFRKAKKVELHISDDFEQLRLTTGYDHNWVLNNFNGNVRKVASVYDAKSGRVLDVLTDQPGIQFYTGNFLDGIKGKKCITYKSRAGLCLETQFFPDSPNKKNFPSAVLRPGETYTQTTIYQFSTK